MHSKNKPPIQDRLLGYPIAALFIAVLVHGWAEENANDYVQKTHAQTTEHGTFILHPPARLDLQTTDGLLYQFDLNASATGAIDYKPVGHNEHNKNAPNLSHEWVISNLCLHISNISKKLEFPDYSSLSILSYIQLLPYYLESAAREYGTALNDLDKLHCTPHKNALEKTDILALAPA